MEPRSGGQGTASFSSVILRLRSRLAALLLGLALVGLPGASAAQQSQTPPSGLLAVVGRQAAWLNLEAPRHRQVSRFPSTVNALELTAQADQSHVVVAVGGAFGAGGARGADLFNLDLTSGDASPLLQRADARESLNSPAW